MRYVVICNFIHVWRHKIIKHEKITSYLHTCSFYQKVSSYHVFQYKISIEWAIWQYDNFENRGAVRLISTNFQSENGFELTTDRRIKFWAIDGTTDPIIFPHYVPPPYYIIDIIKLCNLTVIINNFCAHNFIFIDQSNHKRMVKKTSKIYKIVHFLISKEPIPLEFLFKHYLNFDLGVAFKWQSNTSDIYSFFL